MTESEQQGKTSTELPGAVKDVLLSAYKEHADEARQHESQRERMTTLIIAIGAGSLGLATTKFEGVSLSLLGSVLIVLGLYGAIFSLKHYERNRAHTGMLRAIGDRLIELYPETQLHRVRAQARADHSVRFWFIEWLRLHYLWIGLPLMVSILGVALVFSK